MTKPSIPALNFQTRGLMFISGFFTEYSMFFYLACHVLYGGVMGAAMQVVEKN